MQYGGNLSVKVYGEIKIWEGQRRSKVKERAGYMEDKL